jgi:hypothetical protein
MTPAQRLRIFKRCLRCRYALMYGADLRCTHHLCPMHIGGWGTEWAEKCTKFEKGGARMEVRSTRPATKEERERFLKSAR